jgi:hypothetical protein
VIWIRITQQQVAEKPSAVCQSEQSEGTLFFALNAMLNASLRSA